MARIIAVTNLKGGIGKTTTVVNLAAGFALKGARVLVVDVDAQGNLALALGVQPRRTLYEVLVDGARAADCITPARPNLDLLAADDTLLMVQPIIAARPDWSRVLDQALRPLRSRYDVIFIDCGGSLTVLNVNALVASSDVVVPTTVETLSIKGLALLLKQLIKLKSSTSSVRVIVPTMYDPRTRQGHELLDQLHTSYGALVTPPIRVNIRLSEATAAGRTIYEFDPRSRGAMDYAQLVEHVARTLGYDAQPRPSAPALAASEPSPLAAAVPLQPVAIAGVVGAPEAAETPDQPIVTGAGYTMQLNCPNCGQPLQRATIAGYRVVYCDHCHYRRQDLASGIRR